MSESEVHEGCTPGGPHSSDSSAQCAAAWGGDSSQDEDTNSGNSVRVLIACGSEVLETYVADEDTLTTSSW